MKNEALRAYASLLVKRGIFVEKEDEVYILAEVSSVDFVLMVVEECYKQGAKRVYVDWSCQELSRLHYLNCSLDVLSELPSWELEKVKYRASKFPSILKIISADPDGLNDICRDTMAKVVQEKYPLMKPYLDKMENKYKWTIAAFPSLKWALKIFPNEENPVDKLLEAILAGARANGDAIDNWDKHDLELQEKCAYLNSLNLEYLVYKSSNGTNLKVGLIEDSLFYGGGEYTEDMRFFNPNIPTEEVFISPKKGLAEGIVYSTKPLSYQGQLIENFSLEFKEGKVVKVQAQKNQELLEKMVSMDEGASYLGECALVPFDSPINNSNILFYSTLFDENASCHLALGRGFSNCLKNYEKLSKEDYINKGINQSMIHVDFMIGSSDLEIKGITREGKEVILFQNGNWRIEK